MTTWKLLMVMAFAAPIAALSLGAEEKEGPSRDPRLDELHLNEAQRWEMWLNPEHKARAEMIPEPVFRWRNLSRENAQTGAMYVWSFEGRPVVIGGVFSNHVNGRRVVLHEFHALGPDRLYPIRTGPTERQWTPKKGITLVPIPESPKVEEAFAKRTLQLRNIARDFTARETDPENRRWELRLLPKPLYRYAKPQGDVIDGALMALVSDAGTDPEIILILEARRSPTGDTGWYYRPVRMSISDLYVDYKGTRVWTSLQDDPEGALGNKDETYYILRDRLIDEFPPQ